MPFNTVKYVNEQQKITQNISSLENSRPQLPKSEAENISLEVKLLKGEQGNEYPIIEADENGQKIIITNSNHLELINFIKDIFQ